MRRPTAISDAMAKTGKCRFIFATLPTCQGQMPSIHKTLPKSSTRHGENPAFFRRGAWLSWSPPERAG